MIIVSACLLGVNCRYDGGNSGCEKALRLIKGGGAVPVCPEQLGGCPTPRLPAEIAGGTAEDVLEGRARVVDKNGEDVTGQFVKGAYETLNIARAYGATEALLKSRSPSCGCGLVYDGSFTGTLTEGDGVTACLLKKNGIKVECV